MCERKHQRREREHDRHKPAGQPVKRALDRRFALLGFRDDARDAGKCGVVTDTRGFDDERAGFSERADENFAAGSLGDRHAFAGDRRLVDAGGAGTHDAIGRDPFAGADDDDVTGFKFSGWDFNFGVAAANAGCGR